MVGLVGLRPGMEHLDFRVRVTRLDGVRVVKTYSGLEHRLLEGAISDEYGSLGFVAWNEKIDQFQSVGVGDSVELGNCFVTSFRGVLQINVGRDSEARKVEA